MREDNIGMFSNIDLWRTIKFVTLHISVDALSNVLSEFPFEVDVWIAYGQVHICIYFI